MFKSKPLELNIETAAEILNEEQCCYSDMLLIPIVDPELYKENLLGTRKEESKEEWHLIERLLIKYLVPESKKEEYEIDDISHDVDNLGEIYLLRESRFFKSCIENNYSRNDRVLIEKLSTAESLKNWLGRLKKFLQKESKFTNSLIYILHKFFGGKYKPGRCTLGIILNRFTMAGVITKHELDDGKFIKEYYKWNVD